ncbi:hypothetical protein [Micromonospora sp. NBRC 110038]|uniref:hypothetical protein n=1 Tax=Micromonospora sp. NBRC 110038 TaxID=1550034 RepID=UPI001E491454|nr:hypothetical protein [Micromonospora sp. NBRC 110038]
MRRWLVGLGGTAASTVALLEWRGLVIVAMATVGLVLALCWVLSDDSRSRRLKDLIRELRRQR